MPLENKKVSLLLRCWYNRVKKINLKNIMRVPIRKPGKYTHEKADPHITQKKYEDLKYKLEKIKKHTRPPLIDEVKRLALMGDFSDNAAYSIAKGRLRGVNQKIIEIEDLLKRSQVIRASQNEKVQLGNYVTIEINGKQKKYQILGSTETDPSAGVISHNSPIGFALMAHKVGDIIEVRTKDKIVKYKILKID